MLAIHALALSLVLHLRASSGFSFTIDNTPQQCSNLNISIIGSGQPPYSAIIVPYGSTPLPNSIEAREVQDVSFIGASTSTNFQLLYPENSQFVVVVSNLIGNAVEQDFKAENYHRLATVRDLALEERALQYKSKPAAIPVVTTMPSRAFLPSPSVPPQTTSSLSVPRHELVFMERRRGKCRIVARIRLEFFDLIAIHLGAFNSMA